MTGRRVRVGIVGTSWWTDSFHIPALASHPLADIVSVCGRDRDRAEQLADRHAVPQVFSDYREMFASAGLDAVVIATPDDLHRDMVLDAFASGLHVLCEKPLASSADDAREMLDAAEASGRVHMVMFTWRWLGIFAYMHALIASGYLGQCRDAHFLMHHGSADDPTYQWRYDPSRGGGILADFGSHMIDLAHWFVGDITGVGARLTAHVGRSAADGSPMTSLNDSALLTVDFAGGAQGSIEVSSVRIVGDPPSYEARLYGDEGSLEADIDMADPRLRGRRRGDPSWQQLSIPAEFTGTAGGHPAIMNFPILTPLTNLPVGDRLFVDAVLGQRPARPTFEDGWRAQRVVDAAVRSDRERRWVAVHQGR